MLWSVVLAFARCVNFMLCTTPGAPFVLLVLLVLSSGHARERRQWVWVDRLRSVTTISNHIKSNQTISNQIKPNQLVQIYLSSEQYTAAPSRVTQPAVATWSPSIDNSVTKKAPEEHDRGAEYPPPPPSPSQLSRGKP